MEIGKELKRKMAVKRIASFAIIAIAYLFVQFHRNSTGVIKADLMDIFSMSAASFGTLSAMYFYPYMLMQMPMGALLDVVGVKKIVALGCFLAAIGSVIFARAQVFGVACLGRALIGVGVSAPVVGMQKFVASWYPENRSASGFSTAAFIGNGGALIAQYPLAWAVAIISWRTVFWATAAISLMLAIMCWLIVENAPEDCGFPSMARLEGKPEKKKAASLNFKNIARAIGKTYKNKYIWPILIIMPIHQGLQALFSATFAVPYLRDVYGYSNIQAAGFTSAMMTGMTVFGLLVGKISDRVRSRKIVLASISGIMTLMWLILSYGPGRFMSTPLLWFSMFVMGLSGCGVQIMFSYSREVNDPNFVGVSVSAVNFVGMIASAAMPTLCGVILDKYAINFTGAALYQKAFTLSVILAMISFVLSLTIKETRCYNRYDDFVR